MPRFLPGRILLIAVLLTVAPAPLYGRTHTGACLRYAYPNGKVPKAELRFDLQFDRTNAEGSSFSCGPAIAAFQARRALEFFRDGVLYHDREHFNAVVRYPIQVGVQKTLEAKPQIVVVHNFAEWSALQKSSMTTLQKAAIACSWLGNVTVRAGYRSPGFFLTYGLGWFQPQAPGPAVQVTSIIIAPITVKMLQSPCFPAPGGYLTQQQRPANKPSAPASPASGRL